jgi:hypothetical protein
MTLDDFANIALLVALLIGGGLTSVGVLLLYIMAMGIANERD